MNKKLREKIRLKYDNHCAYCGCVLGKTFHVDHQEPVIRYNKQVSGGWEFVDNKPKYSKPKYEVRMEYPERDNINNYQPACPSCNINKHSMTLEQFRETISGYVNSLNLRNTQYKMAKKYKLVVETEYPVVFYFEKLGHET